MRIAVFASGNGSNFQAIHEAVQSGQLQATIACVIYDRADAYVRQRAEQAQIPAHYVNLKVYPDKVAYETTILSHLQVAQVDLIILAGYMKIIGPTLLNAYPQRILNIHPSLLPAFPGKSGILDAYTAGVSTTGVTVHLVDAGVDTGPILQQASVSIREGESLDSLTERIHQVEHRLYPEVIQTYIQQLIQEGDSL
ncbi:phosphoribosylglycinamide formyltransferase [Aerococcaceae bacterium NML180378]|nr:phosphoribosylglycinamide formyltransferase [Aerococcaceae bacterium NML180378]